MINEVNKPEVKQTVVVYAGRFQPFHPGHYAVYKHLVDKFGKNNVYIGSSDDTSGPKSPLRFKEKKLIAVDIFGVPNNRFVKVKNPYRPVEILDKYDGKITQYVAALGEKDSERLSGKYFKPYKGKPGYGYDEIGYIYEVPMQSGGISATEVRKGISNKDKIKAREFFKKVYPKYDAEIFGMIRSALMELKEDGFPGGIFTGLTSPQGYINGAPKPKDVKKMRKKLDSEIKKETNMSELISAEEAEKIFQNFLDEYLADNNVLDNEKEHYVPNTGMFNRKLSVQQKIDKLNPARAKQKSKIWHKTFSYHDPESGETEKNVNEITQSEDSKKKIIDGFIQYASDRLKLKDIPTIKLVTKNEMGEDTNSLGGYDPVSKEIRVQSENRLSADIIRTVAHEMVHRKQDELGLIKNPVKDGSTGSPIENQANSIAGILLRDYGRVNKKIYSESIIKESVVTDEMDSVINNIKEKLKEKYPSLYKIEYDMTNKKYTFVFNDKSDSVNFQHNFQGTKYQKVEFDRADDYSKNGEPYYAIRFKTTVREDITIPVNKGDEILVGKFKNKRITVKDIGKDDHGMPTVNGRSVVNFRSGKKKELNEVSILGGADSQPDGAYLPKGKTRILGKKDGVNKKDSWFLNGGYEQVDFPTADGLFSDEDGEIQNSIVYSDDGVPRFIGNKTKFASAISVSELNERLLKEGGAAGHMAHPFDDMNLTFGDLKNIITGALTGELGVVKEKLDGQALAISWKNGRLIAARNKSHLQNSGKNAMGIEEVESKFAGRGSLTDAYNFAMRDLNAAISGLSKKQQEKIFNEGKCFMNIEVLWPESANVIPYGQALLVFHNTTCYDDDGSPINSDASAARTLAGMIQQINANIQEKYTIKGPAITDIPKNQELSSKQGQFMSKLNKLQNEFKCKDTDTVAVYHEHWWKNFIQKNCPIKIDKLTEEALVRRWAFGDRSFRLNTISNESIKEWAIKTDKVDVEKQQRENMAKFEEIFLGVGAEVLQFVSSAATVSPDSAVRAMKDELKTAISMIKKSGDPKNIQKFKEQLKKLNTLGGIKKIVPIEGLVFVYKDKVYKLTGTFAPLNQILGLMKYT